MIREES